MKLRFAPIIALLALLLIALASARAAGPQRLYMPLILAPTAVGAQAPIAPLPSVTLTPSATPPDATATPNATATPSATATATVTSTATVTPTTTTPSSATATATMTLSATATVTPSVTATATVTPSATATVTPPLIEAYGKVSFWPEYAEWSMDGINQVCERRSDNMWRSTIPPEHFQAVNGLTYPNVGEVFLTNLETRNQYVARINADISGRLFYRFTDVPSGEYYLFTYLFYKHPLDPANSPRMYARIDTGTYIVADLIIRIGPGPNMEWPDLKLRLSGDVCALS